MRGGDEGNEKGEKSRRGKDSPLDHEIANETLGWAARWSDNSNSQRSHEPPLPHLFWC